MRPLTHFRKKQLWVMLKHAETSECQTLTRCDDHRCLSFHVAYVCVCTSGVTLQVRCIGMLPNQSLQNPEVTEASLWFCNLFPSLQVCLLSISEMLRWFLNVDINISLDQAHVAPEEGEKQATSKVELSSSAIAQQKRIFKSSPPL